MNVELDLQSAPDAGATPPDADLLRRAVEAALAEAGPRGAEAVELSLRIVGLDESAMLNGRYRDRHYATNVLSFPAGAQIPDLTVLGDLVICAAVVEREALTQHKTFDAHWTHMTVHGVLHLLGFDHIGDDEAEAMEALETAILARLGYDDPYQ